MKLNQQLHKSQPDDLGRIAECHMACFPDSLAIKLGRCYVIKTLQWFLVDDSRFLFHLEQNGTMLGYCGGFIPRWAGDGSSSGMLQHAFKEAVIGVLKKPWLIFNQEVKELYPFIRKNIVRKFYKKKISAPPPLSARHENVDKHSGLVVIGVHPQFRGTGIFSTLMTNFINESKMRDVTVGYLSVKKDNNRGIAAYKKTGWQVDKEFANTYIFIKHL